MLTQIFPLVNSYFAAGNFFGHYVNFNIDFIHIVCYNVLLEGVFMEQKKIDRISELTRISRQRELTEAEKAEREALRNEYRAAFTGNLRAQLENMSIIEPDGTIKKVKENKNRED